MRDLPNIMARVFGAPLLIAPAKLDTVLTHLGPRILGEAALTLPTAEHERPARMASMVAPYTTQAGTSVTGDGVAVISIVGTMVRRGGWLDAASGAASYDGIQSEVLAAFADPQVNAVLMDLDTSGGEAGGVFDTADTLRAAAAQTGKPLWAVANDMALSAGYALAVAADQIWITRTGEVGSIGVVMAHVDQSGYDKNLGVKWTYIHAGAHKIDGNPHAPLPDGVKADIQEEIDRIYGMFVDHVANSRKLSPEAIRATEARVYSAEQAVALGLADRIGTLAAAAQALGGTDSRRTAANNRRLSAATLSNQLEVSLMAHTPAEPSAAGVAEPGNTDQQVTGAPPPAGNTGAEASATGATGALEPSQAPAPEPALAPSAAAAETARAAGLARLVPLATKLGVTFDLPKAIANGTSVDAARTAVFNEAVERDEATAITTAHPAPEAGIPLGANTQDTPQAAANFWERFRAKRTKPPTTLTGKSGR